MYIGKVGHTVQSASGTVQYRLVGEGSRNGRKSSVAGQLSKLTPEKNFEGIDVVYTFLLPLLLPFNAGFQVNMCQPIPLRSCSSVCSWRELLGLIERFLLLTM